MSTMVDNDLVNDLISHLELGVRGGVPSPEYAAQLLRRVNLAVVESRRGFADQNAGPPAPEAA